MNDNMIYSMATHLGTDIALVKKMEQDQISNVIRVYHADLPSPVTNVPLTSSAGWEQVYDQMERQGRRNHCPNYSKHRAMEVGRFV